MLLLCLFPTFSYLARGKLHGKYKKCHHRYLFICIQFTTFPSICFVGVCQLTLGMIVSVSLPCPVRWLVNVCRHRSYFHYLCVSLIVFLIILCISTPALFSCLYPHPLYCISVLFFYSSFFRNLLKKYYSCFSSACVNVSFCFHRRPMQFLMGLLWTVFQFVKSGSLPI